MASAGRRGGKRRERRIGWKTGATIETEMKRNRMGQPWSIPPEGQEQTGKRIALKNPFKEEQEGEEEEEEGGRKRRKKKSMQSAIEYQRSNFLLFFSYYRELSLHPLHPLLPLRPLLPLLPQAPPPSLFLSPTGPIPPPRILQGFSKDSPETLQRFLKDS